MTRFGEQRLVRSDASPAERVLFRLLGVADPAHYLHSLYFRRSLDLWPDLRPAAILDAGCGRGDYSFYLARRFPAARVLGLDIDEGRVARNRESARLLGLTNVEFRVADLATDSLPSDVDLIVAIDVLEHIKQQRQALVRLAGALRPGGIAFYHLPTIRLKPVPFSRALSGFHTWAKREHVAALRSAEAFVAEVEASGLRVLRMERTFGYFTGELATSLFALPYANTPLNRMLQGLLAFPCRLLAVADTFHLDRERYAVGVLSRRSEGGRAP